MKRFLLHSKAAREMTATLALQDTSALHEVDMLVECWHAHCNAGTIETSSDGFRSLLAFVESPSVNNERRSLRDLFDFYSFFEITTLAADLWPEVQRALAANRLGTLTEDVRACVGVLGAQWWVTELGQYLHKRHEKTVDDALQRLWAVGLAEPAGLWKPSALELLAAVMHLAGVAANRRVRNWATATTSSADDDDAAPPPRSRTPAAHLRAVVGGAARLAGIPWRRGVVCAGGACLHLADPSRYPWDAASDVDLFVTGGGEVFLDTLRALRAAGHTILIRHGSSVVNAYYPGSPVTIQVIFSKYQNAIELVEDFDLTHLGFFFDGDVLWCTPLAVHALRTGTTRAARLRAVTGQRVLKANLRGFTVLGTSCPVTADDRATFAARRLVTYTPRVGIEHTAADTAILLRLFDGHILLDADLRRLADREALPTPAAIRTALATTDVAWAGFRQMHIRSYDAALRLCDLVASPSPLATDTAGMPEPFVLAIPNVILCIHRPPATAAPGMLSLGLFLPYVEHIDVLAPLKALFVQIAEAAQTIERELRAPGQPADPPPHAEGRHCAVRLGHAGMFLNVKVDENRFPARLRTSPQSRYDVRVHVQASAATRDGQLCVFTRPTLTSVRESSMLNAVNWATQIF